MFCFANENASNFAVFRKSINATHSFSRGQNDFHCLSSVTAGARWHSGWYGKHEHVNGKANKEFCKCSAKCVTDFFFSLSAPVRMLSALSSASCHKQQSTPKRITLLGALLREYAVAAPQPSNRHRTGCARVCVWIRIHFVRWIGIQPHPIPPTVPGHRTIFGVPTQLSECIVSIPKADACVCLRTRLFALSVCTGDAVTTDIKVGFCHLHCVRATAAAAAQDKARTQKKQQQYSD